MSNRKQQYAAFAASAPELPVFCQPWYLDALTRTYGEWDVLLYQKGNGPVRGAFPFFVKSKFGLRYSVPPPLCKYVGPYVLPEYQNDRAVLRYFAAEFPRLDTAVVNFPVATTDFLPFHWAGWRQTTRFTFYLDERAWRGIPHDLEKRTRNRLRRATEQLHVRSGVSLRALYYFNEQVFQRQKSTTPFPFAHLQQLDAALHAREQRRIFGVYDADERLLGALYLIWNARTSYVLISGTDPAFRHLNGNYVLQLEAMRYAFDTLHVHRHDLLGSMLPGVAAMHQKFGAEAHPYHLLTHHRHPLFRLRSVFALG